MTNSVLFISSSFYPKVGGVETHLYQVAKILVEQGWRITVLSNNVAEKSLDGITIINLGVTDQNNKREVWKKIFAHSTLFDQHDIVHVHDVVWWLLPVLYKIFGKLYITFHGWEGDYPVRWQAKLQRWVFAQIATKTIHIGEFIQEFYWDKPNTVLYGGVKNFSPSPTPAIKKLHQKKPNIIFLGRLEGENTIERYLQFFSTLFSLDLQPKVTWVGDGAYRNQCRKFGEVTGMVKHPENYLQTADIVCASSYLSILQAQASGKIVCALHQHYLKQRYLETYPGKDSMIIDHDPVAAAHKIKEILDDKKKFIQMSKNALAFSKTHTWQVVVEQYKKIWDV